MRICYIADGRYIHSYKWLRFFSARGHETFLISFMPLESHHIQSIAESGGVYLGELGRFHIKQFWVTVGNLFWLIKVLHQEQIDILHCHFLGANAWYAALSWFRPLVITVMGGGDICGPDWKPTGGLARLLTPFTLRRANVITSWSRSMAHVIRQYCNPQTPIEVIHGGVDFRTFYPSIKPSHLLSKWGIPLSAKVIFSPRLMRPLSNIDQIAKAAVRVCSDNPDIYFIFAAAPEAKDLDYESKVKSIVQEGGIEKQIRFVGMISHEEMVDYYNLSDITISIADTDGTPMTVLESLVCLTPVIVGDIADLDTDYIERGKTVISVNIGDEASIVEAIFYIIQNPETSKKITDQGRRRVELNGSYESQMLNMEKIYVSLH